MAGQFLIIENPWALSARRGKIDANETVKNEAIAYGRRGNA